MMLRKGLGRGLDAILQEPEPVAGMRELAVGLLQPNRYQPRASFDDPGLQELAASIQAQGVIQPLIVTPGEQGKFVIVAGERRWRAAQKAGLKVVPVVVRELTSACQLLELALVENLQRADLNVIEEAEAYRTLRESFAISQEEIGARVGRGRSTITNALRLLRLPPEVQDLLRSGRLTAGQARPLLALKSRSEQARWAERIVRESLSARQIEARLTTQAGPQLRRSGHRQDDVHATAAAEKLARALQARVEIRRRGKRGTVRIHFHSEEELMRIYDQLLRTGGQE